jgi:hypothetical protein
MSCVIESLGFNNALPGDIFLYSIYVQFVLIGIPSAEQKAPLALVLMVMMVTLEAAFSEGNQHYWVKSHSHPFF